MNRKRWLKVGFGILAAVALAEVVARVHYGLGNPPLYVSDTFCSYALKPHQDLRRFGNRVHINQWGCRSEDLAGLTPSPGTLRILFDGDSVTWGGVLTDQAQTLPYLVAAKLGNTETLNPSCGGWAPANELGWLSEHGTYGSQIVVLVFNDGDIGQAKAPDITATNPNYPSSAPLLGLQELISRYVLPKVFHRSVADPGTGGGAPSDAVVADSLHAVQDEIKLAEKDGAKVIIVLTKLNPAGTQVEGIKGLRARLAALAKAEKVPLLVADLPPPDYRDIIHPNAAGNEAIATQLVPLIRKLRTKLPH